jgi:hypothetical protein
MNYNWSFDKFTGSKVRSRISKSLSSRAREFLALGGLALLSMSKYII